MEEKNSTQCQCNGSLRWPCTQMLWAEAGAGATEEKHNMFPYCLCGVERTQQSSLTHTVMLTARFQSKKHCSFSDRSTFMLALASMQVRIACELVCHTRESEHKHAPVQEATVDILAS